MIYYVSTKWLGGRNFEESFSNCFRRIEIGELEDAASYGDLRTNTLRLCIY